MNHSQTKRQPVSVSPAPEPQQPETPAPTAQPDLLRVHLYDLTEEERSTITPSIVAMIATEITGLSAWDLQAVARFIDLVKRDRGIETPVEAFITDLVSDHYCGPDGITPRSGLAPRA